MQFQLERAISIAVKQHSGQVDKSNRPYILYVLSVVMSNELTSDDERTVAALHDVVEDTDMALEDSSGVSIDDLFPPHIVEAVDTITRRDGKTYKEYIQQVKKNELARKVKIVDLNHNLSRLHNLPEEQQGSMRRRYGDALAELEG